MLPESPYPRPPRRGPASLLRRAVVAVIGVLLLPYVLTPLYSFGHPVSTLMLARWLTGQRVERIYTPIEQIPRSITSAVLVAEDSRFCDHYGVDFTEIGNSIAEAEDLDDLRGSSTITQQVVKNLFLWNGRNFLRKALEFPLALWVDLVLSKRRILELYLNIAEWGPDGEFGIQAAARRSFGRSAGNIGSSEAALLAATLPNPAARDARRPGPGLRRLAGLYVSRAASSPNVDQCVRRRP
ncbi:MAG: monofunctional biosynthetic peptidoglycan transglycosylase [Pseudolabrys sp.]|nr:monofunctional biosynthetic peptidoglycan transglycosylase [Pseudolabrys sp.]